jgi:hypothetical protein
MIADKDLAKAFLIVDNMKQGEIISINNILEERRDLFIRCIKQRIDTLNDCEFNPDYTKIRKLSDFCNFDLNN